MTVGRTANERLRVGVIGGGAIAQVAPLTLESSPMRTLPSGCTFASGKFDEML